MTDHPTPTRDAGPATANDGGPAFPVTAGNQVYATGMPLRDWFAGQAGENDIFAHISWDLEADAPDCTREQAKYRYADAMIAARSGGSK